MAFSDWTIVQGATTPVLNSGLSNPLPALVSGSFARLFAGNPTDIISNNKPEFVNIPSTKSIRASLCMRRQTAFSSGFRSGLRVKASNSSSNGGTGQGYGLVMDTGASGQITLRVNNGAEHTIDGLPAGSFYSSNWIRLRIEVTPVGANDQILVYRETVIGSGVWDLLAINGGLPSAGITIAAASPQFAPWGAGAVYIQNGYTDHGLYVDTVELSATTI